MVDESAIVGDPMVMRDRKSLLFPLPLVVFAIGLASLGGKCDPSPTPGSDGGSSDASRSVDASADGQAQSVAATCVDVCRCLASACPDFPFAPDCVTACQDPTNNPAWDLSCRAGECGAAFADHDGHCAMASGQSKCH
jgi:hypothetical protein